MIASKPDEYVFVYYRGNNDAWRGYGGAVVYTRAAALPKELVPELRAAASAAGLRWDDFTLTDNTCGPHPPRPPSLLAEVEGDVMRAEEAAGARLRSFGRGFTVLERRVASELAAEERALERELRDFEAALEKAEKAAARRVVEEEQAVAGGVQAALSKLAGLFGGGGGAGKA